jgi:hypothetical protein
MKKFWIVLLLIMLIMAFALPVSAADVKFSGSYVAQGYYDNNRALVANGGASVSDTWQRLRVQTDFKIQEGLMLTTRFDALEKIWGASRSATATSTSLSGNDDESENIKFTHAYVTFGLPIVGTFKVGYQTQSVWGTSFGDTGETDYGPRVVWDLQTGPFYWGARWDKIEGSKYYSSTGPAGNVGVSTYEVEHDYEKYSVLGGYNWDKGNVGLQITYYLNTTTDDSPTTGYKAQYWAFQPYAKAQLGIVYVESEFGILMGKDKAYGYQGGGNIDRTISGWRGYVMANVDLAPAYVGALAFYATGDDQGTADKNEGGAKIGTDFNPCLILFNYDLGRWNGLLGGQNGLAATTAGKAIGASNSDNVQALQIFAGIKPMPKLDVKASYTTAGLDKDAVVGQVSKNIGSELDISATYKIYDNLSYMVGFGYLFAGDAFKGTNAGASIDNDYLVTHKLTLTF